MTIDRAHIEFQVGLDKRDTSQVPEVPAEQIDLFLNSAILRWVKTRYGGNNIYRTSGEETQKRLDDLRVLLKTVSTVPTLLEEEERTYAVGIPSIEDYMFLARFRVKTKKGVCPSIWCGKVNYVQQDDLEVARVDPFNKTRPLEPIVYFEHGDLYVLADDTFDVEKARVTYYSFPIKVNVGTYGEPKVEFQLPEHTHDEIVLLAVEIALETLESQRIQTIQAQIKNVE